MKLITSCQHKRISCWDKKELNNIWTNFIITWCVIAKLSSSCQFHLKLSWVSSIITVSDPTRPDQTRPVPEKFQNSFLQQYWLSNNWLTSLTESKSVLTKWKTTSIFQEMEDDLNLSGNGRQPQFFQEMEDDLNFPGNGTWPQFTISWYQI